MRDETSSESEFRLLAGREKRKGAARAGAGWVFLTDAALYAGYPLLRIPREAITGIEFDRGGTGPGAIIFLGKKGELVRAEFDGLDRRGLARIESALAPRRKRLEILLEGNEWTPGDRVRGRVVVEWPRRAPVRGIRVGLAGVEETCITEETGMGEDRRTTTYREDSPIIDKAERLFGRPRVNWFRAVGESLARIFRRHDYPVLRAGKHEYEFEFRLPGDAPPTYEGTHATIGYRLWAHVDIPQGFDLAFEGELPVRPGGRIEARRLEIERRGRGLLKRLHADLSMDLEIAECALRVGEHLRGRLRVENRSKKRIRGATVRLESVETSRAEGAERSTPRELAAGYLSAPDPSAPFQEITFGIKIPAGTVAYLGRHSRVDLSLVAELDVAMGFDAEVQVPLQIR